MTTSSDWSNSEYALAICWPEFNTLTMDQRTAVIADHVDVWREHGIGVPEYRREIGDANLRDYAEMMLIRARMGVLKVH